MQKNKQIELVLEDGTKVKGNSFGAEKSIAGEVVFNTAMTGYPESLTDPSYKGQILVLTYPLIGNYGVPGTEREHELLRFFESFALHISGLIISDYSWEYSHWNAKKSLSDWLKEYNIPGIFDVDTRALTKILREKGTMLGKILVNGEDIDWYDPNQENLVEQVSIKEKKTFGSGKYKVALLDCGVKYNIIRNLVTRDVTVDLLPWNYDLGKVEYDGLFISNGPGDPKKCEDTIQNLSKAIKQDTPVCGICLGNQLLGLAAGADSYKLKYGHRSHNQPVLQIGTNNAYITSQNHGYAINNDTLPEGWKPLFINLNDDTNEGMKHESKMIFSSQFHPEASGGPTDTEFLFDMFIDNIKQYREG